MNPKLSIIIPVFRESAFISPTLHTILDLNIPVPFEIIVCDGESSRSTLTHLKADKTLFGHTAIKLIAAAKGRGPQLNAGVKKAVGEFFVFLHADTRMDQNGMNLMLAAWQDHVDPLFCGAFDLCIDSEKKVFRIIEKIASARSRFTRIPYGDQGIFMSRQLFEKINGFPDVPIMEDVGIMSRVKKKGVHPIFLPHPVCTSARRWKKQGIIFTTFRNWALISLYFFGVPPRVLEKFY